MSTLTCSVCVVGQGHCQRFKPEYIALANQVPDIDFYAVSCIAHNDLCQKNEVKAWPTIMTFVGSVGTVLKRGTSGVTEDAIREAFVSNEESLERKLKDADDDEDQTAASGPSNGGDGSTEAQVR